MQRARRSAFTLIELLVVIAIIAIVAAILFPVFAQAREKARMSVCMSNMRQIGLAMMQYVQDNDETFPYIRFHGSFEIGTSSDRGHRIYGWNNAIRPYLKNIDVFACPSNPYSRSITGAPASDPGNLPKPGSNATGWEVEPEQRMPVSYSMNACAVTWIPAEDSAAGPPLRLAQLARPADTIIVAEGQSQQTSIYPEFLWHWCYSVFAHPTGKMANFVFCDGHAKSKKWLDTVYPLTENNWQIDAPNPDPSNRKINGPPGCQFTAPSDPGAREFRTPKCLAYQ